MQTLNILNFIEKNPIKKLSEEYNNKFLIKIKGKFIEIDEQLSVSLFYNYLNYKTTDLVIDVNSLHKIFNFNQAKSILENSCKIETATQIAQLQSIQANKN